MGPSEALKHSKTQRRRDAPKVSMLEASCAQNAPGRSAKCPPKALLPRNCHLPKGPFRTKNSTAPESVVFCYHRSFSLSVPFSCLFVLEKQAFLSPLRSVLLRPYRIFSPYRNSLSVVFLVREGPLGGSDPLLSGNGMTGDQGTARWN